MGLRDTSKGFFAALSPSYPPEQARRMESESMLPSIERTTGRVGALAALELSGADALGFAQRICANDVAALVVGDWQWNCVLSPQGRVLALFRLWRRAEDALTLVLPASARVATHTLLRRYLLRAKVQLTEANTGLMGGNSPVAEPSRASMQSDDGRWLAVADANDPGLADCTDISEFWRAQDMARGVPWLDPDAVETFTPQALSLDRLDAFSVRKGCYPGQEIVARMHFLGQNKRELRRFASSQAIAVGTSLCATGTPQRLLGTVLMVASSADEFEMLAVVQRAAAGKLLSAGAACDVPLQALAFDAAPMATGRAPLAKA